MDMRWRVIDEHVEKHSSYYITWDTPEKKHIWKKGRHSLTVAGLAKL